MWKKDKKSAITAISTGRNLTCRSTDQSECCRGIVSFIHDVSALMRRKHAIFCDIYNVSLWHYHWSIVASIPCHSQFWRIRVPWKSFGISMPWKSRPSAIHDLSPTISLGDGLNIIVHLGSQILLFCLILSKCSFMPRCRYNAGIILAFFPLGGALRCLQERKELTNSRILRR